MAVVEEILARSRRKWWKRRGGKDEKRRGWGLLKRWGWIVQIQPVPLGGGACPRLGEIERKVFVCSGMTWRPFFPNSDDEWQSKVSTLEAFASPPPPRLLFCEWKQGPAKHVRPGLDVFVISVVLWGSRRRGGVQIEG